MKYGTEAIVERVTRDVIFSPLFTKNKIQSLEMGLPINKSGVFWEMVAAT